MIQRTPLLLSTTAAIRQRFTIVLGKRGVLQILSKPGMGKTYTAKLIAQEHKDAIIITATREFRSFGGVVDCIINATEIYTNARYNREKVAVLKSNLETWPGAFLICDEAQNLDGEALRFLLELWDEFKIPIILLGNRDLIRKTRGDEAAFDQIANRVTDRIELSNPTQTDVESFCVEYNVAREAYPRMITWGQTVAFRDIADVLENAAAAIASGPVRLDDISHAIKDRFGEKSARQFFAAKYRGVILCASALLRSRQPPKGKPKCLMNPE